jgi:hypothetical protein
MPSGERFGVGVNAGSDGRKLRMTKGDDLVGELVRDDA